MGWGDAFSNAWDAAKDTARAAATKAADTAESAYDAVKQKAVQGAEYARDKAVQGAEYARDKAVQGAEYARDKAVQGYNYAHDKAVQGYDYAKDKATQLRDAARNKARDLERAAFDKGYDAVAGAAERGRRAYKGVTDKARQAYDKARSLFGTKTVGSPVQPCPHAINDPTKTDGDRDGWIMVPQGEGQPCKAVPPGKDALAQARSQSVQSQSDCCKARRAGQPVRDIIYVNGIQNTSADHCDTLNAIAAQTCGRIVGVYNATAGKDTIKGFAVDGAQTGQDRRLVKAAGANKAVPTQDGRNPAVDTLARAVADEVESGNSPELWAHSQGGAVTSLALYEARNDLGVVTGSPDPLKGMKVKSFGSAAPQWANGPEYEHYVHMNDPVPTMLGLGHNPAGDGGAAGAGAKVVRFSGDVSSSAPFEMANPAKEWLPINLDNHAVAKSYLKMEKQLNGGCP